MKCIIQRRRSNNLRPITILLQNAEQQQTNNAGQRNAERFVAPANVETDREPTFLRLPFSLASTTFENLSTSWPTHSLRLSDSFEGSKYRRRSGNAYLYWYLKQRHRIIDFYSK